jgi:hypothetical protein
VRFMMIVKGNADYEAGRPPSPELTAAIGKLSQNMGKSGVLLDTGGLLPSSKGARLHLSKGRIAVVDGPFAEAKELIGGYAIVQARSKEEAVELGKRFLEAHLAAGDPGLEVECEIRQFAERGCEP